jgi:hypothetical protein
MKISDALPRNTFIPMLGLALFVGSTTKAFADDLLSVLQRHYVPTQTTLDRSQLTSIGTVLTVQVAGINTEPWGTILNLDNKIVDGKVQQSRWGQIVKNPNMYVLQPGDKVFVTKMESKQEANDDLLKLSLLTCDPRPVPSGGLSRYVASVSFKLAKNTLAESSPDQVEQVVDAVLTPDGLSAPQAAPSIPLPAPAPQPPAPTQTIGMGETIDQVQAALGQPQQIIDLGSKKIYKYASLKVVFVDGRVSDVQ